MAGPDSRVIIGPPLSDEPETKSGEPRDASGDEWLGPDFVEHVVAPRPLSQDDFEFLRREHRLLVLENIFDGNSRARGVDPRVHPISLEELRGDEVHEEQIRLPSVFLGEGLQLRGHLHPRLADLLRDDDPKDAGISGPYDRGMSLSEHVVPHLLQIPRGPAFRVRDNDRLVDEDRDTEGVEVSRADVEVTVDLPVHDRRRMIVATEELTRVGDPSVGLADLDDMTFLLEV